MVVVVVVVVLVVVVVNDDDGLISVVLALTSLLSGSLLSLSFWLLVFSFSSVVIDVDAGIFSPPCVLQCGWTAGAEDGLS